MIRFVKITGKNRELAENLYVQPFQSDYIETVAECMIEADENTDWRPFAVYDEEEMIGFVMYGCITEEKWGSRVWMDRILIDHKFQGRGYGRKTIKYLIEKILKEYNVDKIYLSVYEENIVAVHLYKDFGFRFTGELDTKGEQVMSLSRESVGI